MYVLVCVAAGVGMSGLATSGPSSSSYAGQVLADMVSGRVVHVMLYCVCMCQCVCVSFCIAVVEGGGG